MSVDQKVHDELRERVRSVYAAIPAEGVYFNSRSEMEFTYKGPDGKIRKSFIDPMTSAVVMNALVPKSGVILRGGHGGGKTTLVEKVSYMLTGVSEEEISAAMIRGNDDANVNTLLSTLRLGKLLTKGDEEVLWRKFVTCPVKIIDEVNRFPPPVQNALFELLNRGRVEFLDQVYENDDFIAYATENPADTGTYPLSKPFVDRFAFCVPAPQIPSADDQYLLAERYDDKLRAVSVKPVMGMDELKKVRRLISEDVRVGSDALIYIIYLTQAVSTCERGDFGDKSHNEIVVGERCKGCGFDTPASVCKMTETGLSGRAFLDFQRWGKAYAWFLNAFPDADKPQVQVETIQTIAPYLMYHRVIPTRMVIGRDPYNGLRLKFLEDVVQRSTQGYNTIKDALTEIPRVLRGEVDPKDAKINSVEKDLVVKYHFRPLVREADNKEFRALFKEIEDSEMTPERLSGLKRRLALATELRSHAQKFLLAKALTKARREDHL